MSKYAISRKAIIDSIEDLIEGETAILVEGVGSAAYNLRIQGQLVAYRHLLVLLAEEGE